MRKAKPFAMPPGTIRFIGGVLSVALLAFLIYAFAAVALAYLSTLFQPWAETRGWPEQESRALLAAAASVLACLVGLLGLGFLAGQLEGVRLRLAFGTIRRRQLAVLFKYFVIHLGLLFLLALATVLLGWQERLEGPELELDFSLWGTLLPLLVVGLAVPIFEECLFRGYLHARLRRIWRFGPAFALSGMLFSLLHFNPEGSLPFNLFAMANILMLTYFITKTFEETGNLWLPIAFHGLHNARVVFFVWFFPAAVLI